MDSFLQDVRYALRGLARSPGFTAAVVATLALGIGANTTMFGVLDTLLLKPPAHVRDPGRVARVYFRYASQGRPWVEGTTSVPTYESLRALPAFAAAAASFDARLSEGAGESARPVDARGVTASYFPLLGVRAARGRFFDSTEDRVGAAPVAVVSFRYWRRELAGDTGVLHRTLPIGRFSYAIVGVAPDGFTGADLDEPDVWLPLRAAAADLWPGNVRALSSRGSHWIRMLVRLAPGQTLVSAAGRATFADHRAARGSDQPADTLGSLVLGPIQEARGPDVSGDARVALWVGAVALAVLLVACANVANLLLARGVRRRREMAVRAGLGAGRGRLVRQLIVESLVLALTGGAAGLVVAMWGGETVRAFLLSGLPEGTPLLDSRVLVFTLAAATVTGLLAGSVPAWQASRTDLAETLKSGARDVTATRGLLRSMLLGTQVALTLALLVGAGLFVRSLRNVEGLDYGFDLEHLLIATVDVRTGAMARADSPGEQNDAESVVYLRLLEHIQSNPAVASAAISVGTPYGWSHSVRLKVPGLDSLPRVSGGPTFNAVSPDYFATVGARILLGRGFTIADQAREAPRVAVVSRTFARLVWPGRDPIGQCLLVGGNDSACVRVVGVAADTRSRKVSEAPGLAYYLPFGQRLVPPPPNGLLIRTRSPARAVQGEVQRALQRAEAGLPYVRVESLLDRLAPRWRSWRLGATMFTAFGLLALAIASLGLYGVTAYGVAQRTQEIGVRVALGARGADVIRLSVAQAVRATAIGAVVGMTIAYALGRAVSSLLFGVRPADPAAVLAGIAVLLTVAAVAAYVPARRAAQIDPMEALRYE